MTSLTIVTPWKDHREFERDYFAAVLREDAELLIVDDGSDPPLPNGLHLEGVGFARACNTGLAAASTDAVLFLNNDIIARSQGWLEPIREALDQGVLVGAELRNDIHTHVDGELFPYLDGWCIAGMTEDLRELEGFDETFDEPSYYGDNDLSLRARMAGMTLREARVPLTHIRNGTLTPSDPDVRASTARNRERFVLRAREAMSLV